MNVKELKEIIKDLPEGMDIFVAQRKTEFAYGLINSAKVRKVRFVDNIDETIYAYDNVLVFDEE